MELLKKGHAGTLESGDVLVTAEPSPDLVIHLESPVKEQFGPAILDTVRQVLEAEEIKQASIRLEDQGALDCTIRARLLTALRRATAREEGDPA